MLRPQTIGRALDEIARFQSKRGMSPDHGDSLILTAHEMEDVVCFVRGIPYAFDRDTRGVEDWANYLVESLYDQLGDCEDHAILAASILRELGHDVALFFLKLKDSAHIALAYRTDETACAGFSKVAEGKQYSYVETVPAPENASVGDIGVELLTKLGSAEVIPLQRAIR